MANIELVIKIPEEDYNFIKRQVADGITNPLKMIIASCTPLPKGHWIHRMQDGGCFWEECSVCNTERAYPTKYCPDCGAYMYADIRTDAPTIIEADKAGREEI